MNEMIKGAYYVESCHELIFRMTAKNYLHSIALEYVETRKERNNARYHTLTVHSGVNT